MIFYMKFFPIFVILSILGMVIQGAFIAVEHKGKYVPAVILKGTASLVFVIIGIIGFVQMESGMPFAFYDRLLLVNMTHSIALMVVLGLIFGMLGDIFLGLRFVFEKIGQKIFLVGILVFFIGHIFYMIALVPMVPWNKYIFQSAMIGVVAAAVILLLIYKFLEIKLAFKIFGFFYIGAVVIMTAIAIGNWVASRCGFTAMFAIGAFLFMVSDVVMIFNTFGKTQRFGLRITNLGLYYIGQLLIAGALLVGWF